MFILVSLRASHENAKNNSAQRTCLCFIFTEKKSSYRRFLYGIVFGQWLWLKQESFEVVIPAAATVSRRTFLAFLECTIRFELQRVSFGRR